MSEPKVGSIVFGPDGPTGPVNQNTELLITGIHVPADCKRHYDALAAENARLLAAWSRLEADHNAACAENGALRTRLEEAERLLREQKIVRMTPFSKHLREVADKCYSEIDAFLQRTDAGREEKP